MSTVQEQLAAPFAIAEHQFRVMRKTKDGSAAYPIVYIDARQVQDRLDHIFGIGGWKDEYEVVRVERYDNGKGSMHWDAAVECTLTVWMDNGREVVHSDVGTGDGADGMKGAYSDALKRAAVKLGVGRYLYGLGLGLRPYPIESYYPHNFTDQAVEQMRQALAKELGVDYHGSAVRQSAERVQHRQPPPPVRQSSDRPATATEVRNQMQASAAATEDVPMGGVWDEQTVYDPRGGEFVTLGETARKMIEWGMDQANLDSDTITASQYGLLVGLIDSITGKAGSHNTILEQITGMIVSRENLPSKVVGKKLIDSLLKGSKDKQSGEWKENLKYNPRAAEAIKEIWQMVQGAEVPA